MDSTAIAKPAPDEAPPDQQTAGTTRKIFISYSRKDQAFASGLADDLRAAKLSVWIDESEIQGGAAWARTIEEAIYDCTEFVLILSPNSRRSDYVENELIHAKKLGKIIRPVLYETCEPWVHINNVQSIDFRENPQKGLKQLKQPPRQPLWRRILAFPKENPASRPYFAGLAVAIGIAAMAYFIPPSNTTFSVSGGEKSIKVLFHNRGGRPSMLMGSSFRLSFGSLPIETEPLFLVHPETRSRIAGHSDAEISLKSGTLTPKKKSENCYFSRDDITPLLAGATVTLTAQVKESDDRLHTRSEELPAERIKNFILEVYPDDVPCPRRT